MKSGPLNYLCEEAESTDCLASAKKLLEQL